MEYQKIDEDAAKNEEQNKRDFIFADKIDSLIYLKQYNTAISQINKYAAIHSESKIFLDSKFVDIGNEYAKNNQTDSAFKMYSTAIEFSAEDVWPRAARGALYYRIKNYKAALPDFEYAAIENFDYYYNLGLVQQKLKLYQDADTSFTKYLQEYPKCAICKLKIDTLETQIKKYNLTVSAKKHPIKADSAKSTPYTSFLHKYHLSN